MKTEFKKLYDDNKILFVFTIIVTLSYISIFIILGFCAQPSADDFNFSNKVLNYGFINSQCSTYNTWTGRYSSTAIISAFTLCFNMIKYYWLIPLFLIVATFASLYFLIFTIGARHVTKYEAMFATLILLALYLSGVPSPAETFYWLAGGFTYQLGSILYLVSLTILMKIMVIDSNRLKKIYLLTAYLLVAITAGMNETVMFSQSLLLITATFLAFKHEWPKRFILLSILIISILSAAVVVLAPGNLIRSQYFPLAHRFGLSLYLSLKSGSIDIAHWSKSLSLWTASFIFVPLAAEQARRCGLLEYYRKRRGLLAIPLYWFFMMLALYFPAFWSMGQAPPSRTLSIVYMIFIMGWFPSLIALYVAFKKTPVEISPAFLRLITIVFLCSLFVINNGYLALNDLNKGFAYLEEMRYRYEVIGQSKSRHEENIKVPALINIPLTINVTDISGDKDDWKNQSYAEFFGVKSIVTSYMVPTPQ